VTDEALMTAVRDGDLSKLGTLFERHHVAVFDFLSRMTGDRAAAEDLVQDVFVRVLKYRSTYRTDGRFETWLFRIVRNARADYFRARSAAGHVVDDEPDAPSREPGPECQLEREEDLARLQHALRLLREEQREILVLARYRGMTHEQIGDLLGIEAGAVKVRIHRALKQLREVFHQLAETNSWNVRH
jgi:RNA polymerase sigma factor (sigma-70 family)